MKSEVRVRFAPSPTGYLHVGNARTAILNWLFAKHSHGKMILRIEDTDVERSTREYEQAIIDDLRWMGLDWDEGPYQGGDFGPYRQSERVSIYKDSANELLEAGFAFHCYCSAEEIKAKAEAALKKNVDPHYDGHCYELTAEQIRRYEEEGRKPVVRFRVPPEAVSFFDLVRDEMNFEGQNISDFIILRSDGVATYNFAVVVDDALMKISHVIRGEDHLSNTPKQVLLFKALGYDLPTFVHIPMILGSDRSKLSKRHGDSSLTDYRKKGYLPDAVLNFLSLLGWSSETGDEILSRERLIREFDFSRLSKSAAIFNLDKLNWMNGVYLRNTDIDKIIDLAFPHLQKEGFDTSNREYVAQAIRVVIDRIEYLQQIPEWCRMFFQESIRYENSSLMVNEDSRKIFRLFLAELQAISRLGKDDFFQIMKSIQKRTGIKGKHLWMPVRMALTGKEHGPELPGVVELLGKEKCEKFLTDALNVKD